MDLGHPSECIQCGACVSACPVEKVGGHAIVSWLADPQTDDYSVWLCTSCWRCQEVCPVDVDIYGLMMALRRREPAPEGYRSAQENVLTGGLALEISPEDLDQMRADYGLEPVELAPVEIVAVLLDRDDPDDTA